MTQRGPVATGDISSSAHFDPSSIGPSDNLPADSRQPAPVGANNGLGALVDNLLAHGRQGANTLKGIAATWAPPGSTRSSGDYAANLALRTGFSPAQPLDMTDPDTLAKLTKAVIWNEIGSNPIGASQIDQAVQDRLTAARTGAVSAPGPMPATAIPDRSAVIPSAMNAAATAPLDDSTLAGVLAGLMPDGSKPGNFQRGPYAGKPMPYDPAAAAIKNSLVGAAHGLDSVANSGQMAGAWLADQLGVKGAKDPVTGAPIPNYEATKAWVDANNAAYNARFGNSTAAKLGDAASQIGMAYLTAPTMAVEEGTGLVPYALNGAIRGGTRAIEQFSRSPSTFVHDFLHRAFNGTALGAGRYFIGPGFGSLVAPYDTYNGD